MNIPDVKVGEKIIKDLLSWLGVEEGGDSTKETPMRVAKMYVEVLGGMYAISPNIKVFKAKDSESSYVCVTNIDYFSLCSHHILPFTGKCGVVYRVGENNEVIGLSKIPRIIEFFSKRLQLQEHLTNQIANGIFQSKLKPKGVYVVMSGIHSCMTLRGVKAKGAITNTAALVGDIDKEEAISLLNTHNIFGE